MRIAALTWSFHFGVFVGIFLGLTVDAQSNPAHSEPVTHSLPSAKGRAPAAFNVRFDVVSIKRSGDQRAAMLTSQGDSYRAINLPLKSTIYEAYFPKDLRSRQNQILKIPTWVNDERYDIIAKLDSTTFNAWQNLSPADRQERVRSALQSLLAERCKLVTHPVPVHVRGYELVVGKHGSRLKPATSRTNYPSPNLLLAGGGRMVPLVKGSDKLRFFGVSMQNLASTLAMLSGDIVQDKTALSGDYDFDVPRRNDSFLTAAPGEVAESDAGPNLWVIETLGLELKPVKVQTKTIAIDHIERPTLN